MIRLSTLCLLPVMSATAGTFTASAMAGYGLPFPGSTLASEATSTTTSTRWEAIRGSFADGLRVGAGLGYEVSPLARLELGMRYEASSEIVRKDDQFDAIETIRSESRRSVTQVALCPSIVVAFKNEGLRPYARVGGHFGFPTMVSESSRETSSASDPSMNSTNETTWEHTGGIAWGFGGGLGIEIPLGGALSVTGEVVSENWSWAPTDGEKTQHVINGRDVLPEESKSETRQEFVDSYSFNISDYDPDKPSKELRYGQTYSTLALNLGLQMRF